MEKIKRFNQLNEGKTTNRYYTIADLKELIKDLPDDAPVVYSNYNNLGDNIYDNISDILYISNVKYDTETKSALLVPDDDFGRSDYKNYIDDVLALIVNVGD